MAILKSIRAAFSGKKSLAKISLEELRREKIRLDREEAKFIARIEQVEKQKEQLFQQVVNEASQVRETILARRIKEKDEEGKTQLRLVRHLGHQLRIVNGLIAIKEESHIMSKEAVGLLSTIPFDDLVNYMEKATTTGDFERDRIRELLKGIEESQTLATSPLSEEDEDVRTIIAIAQKVRGQVEEGEISTQKLQDGLVQVNQHLAKQQEAASV